MHARRLKGWWGGHCPTEVALWLISDNFSFFYFVSGTSRSWDICVFRRAEWKWVKEAERVCSQIVAANAQYALPPQDLFWLLPKGPRGMFWAKMAHFGPPGTPRKSAFFYERGRKRMKEWRKVTFMKEWMKALDLTVILSYWELLYLFSFRSYSRLKKIAGINKSLIVNLCFC